MPQRGDTEADLATAGGIIYQTLFGQGTPQDPQEELESVGKEQGCLGFHPRYFAFMT